MKQIDARGLDCPAPVLKTKTVIEDEKPDRILVIVDNPAAQQNVQRFLESRGFNTELEKKDKDFLVKAFRDQFDERTESEVPSTDPSDIKKIMVICASDRIGFGDDVLGRKLMVNFLRTIKEMGEELWRLVFINNGVKLTIEGSEVLEDLKAYEEAGLKIMVCGTCLEHFRILDKKQVGETTNMLDIVTSMQVADKVVNM